jgi:hypothetical protein
LQRGWLRNRMIVLSLDSPRGAGAAAGRTPNRAWRHGGTVHNTFPPFVLSVTSTPPHTHTRWCTAAMLPLRSSYGLAFVLFLCVCLAQGTAGTRSSANLLTALRASLTPPPLFPLSLSSMLEGSGMIVLQGAGSGNSGAIVNIWAQGYRFIRDDVRYVACR